MCSKIFLIKWSVVFAAFMSNVITDGAGWCYGIIFPSLLLEYKQNHASIALPGSLYDAVTFLGGILVTSLNGILSCQQLYFAGIGMFVMGFVLTALAPCFEFVYITYGALAGLGRSFILSKIISSFSIH